MKQLKLSEIEDTVLVCPYCMNEVYQDAIGCCGESSCHFETAYISQAEILLESEVLVINDLQNETNQEGAR